MFLFASVNRNKNQVSSITHPDSSAVSVKFNIFRVTKSNY